MASEVLYRNICWFPLAPPACWRIVVEKERGGRTCRVRRRHRYRRPLGVTPPPPPPNGSVSPVAGRPCCDDETPAAVECVPRRRRRRGHCRVAGSGTAMWSPATVRLLVFIGFYVSFLAVGAFVFSAIEAPEEAARVRELKELRQEFLDGHTCVQGTSDPRFLRLVRLGQADQLTGFSFQRAKNRQLVYKLIN